MDRGCKNVSESRFPRPHPPDPGPCRSQMVELDAPRVGYYIAGAVILLHDTHHKQSANLVYSGGKYTVHQVQRWGRGGAG